MEFREKYERTRYDITLWETERDLLNAETAIKQC